MSEGHCAHRRTDPETSSDLISEGRCAHRRTDPETSSDLISEAAMLTAGQIPKQVRDKISVRLANARQRLSYFLPAFPALRLMCSPSYLTPFPL